MMRTYRALDSRELLVDDGSHLGNNAHEKSTFPIYDTMTLFSEMKLAQRKYLLLFIAIYFPRSFCC